VRRNLAAAVAHGKMSHHEAVLAGNAHDRAIENPRSCHSKGKAGMCAVCIVILREGALFRAVLLLGKREGEHAPRLQAMARVEQL
jgi:ferredoxin